MNSAEQKFILVMGVSGSGKSTVAKQVAKELNLSFFDADDYHPLTNIEKMSNAEPLTDDDRWPWLDTLASVLLSSKCNCIFACSALKTKHRDFLLSRLGEMRTICLHGDESIILSRMQSRSHFMPPQLLISQLQIFEQPSGASTITLDISEPMAAVVRKAVAFVRQNQ